MNKLAWPFLVSRNLYLDYRTVIAPEFISNSKISNLLARATDGDFTAQNTAIIREIIGSEIGNFIVIFQIIKATKSDINQGNIEEILKDTFGREIYFIEGLVIEDNLNNAQFNTDIFAQVHEKVIAGYSQFWEEIEPCPAIPSQPFEIPEFDINQSILTLDKIEPFIIKNKAINNYNFFKKHELYCKQEIINSLVFNQDILFIHYQNQSVLGYDLSNLDKEPREFIKGSYDNSFKSLIIISPDHKWIAAGCYSEGKNYVLLKNLANNNEEKKLDEQNWKDLLTQDLTEDLKDRIIISLAFSFDGKFLAAGTKNGRILRWSMKGYKRKVIADTENLKGEVTTLVFSNNDNTLISGDSNGNIWKWQDNLIFSEPLVSNLSYIHSIAISSNNKYLVTGCEDGLIIYNFEKEETLLTLDKYKEIKTVNVSPDNNLIALGTATGEVIIWDIKQQQEIFKYDHQIQVNSVIFHTQNRTLASGDEAGVIQIWKY